MSEDNRGENGIVANLGENGDTRDGRDFQRVVFFVHSNKLIQESDKVEKVKDRGRMLWNLIQSYGLNSQLRLVEPRTATDEELSAFHSREYLNHLKNWTPQSEKCNNSDEEFGLGYDCPLFPSIHEFVSIIGGSSISAAQIMVQQHEKNPNAQNIAINWFGGWHHAQRDSASGFCYVNDPVLAIHTLRKKFQKILYIDLDVHHGDGVENAFNFSPNVFTFSIHQYETGYFPGSGKTSDVGLGKGRYYTANVPLKSGVDDKTFIYVFTNVFDEICYGFHPDAIVCQCGADALAGDPLGGFNLTFNSAAAAVHKILAINKPTLFLGGGGYNVPNTAMYWTFLTAVITGTEIPMDIPDHDPYFTRYGPTYELSILPTLRTNENSPQEIEDILEEIFENLENVSS